VRYVRRPDDLEQPDLIVLPGSKTTLADLAWLRRTGIAARIDGLVAAGTPVLGICGGLQILGAELADTLGVEGRASVVRGLGHLPVRTTFARVKRTVQVAGRVRHSGFMRLARGSRFTAYEIHVGTTRRDGCAPFAELVRAGARRVVLDGAVSADGQIVGTYAHGLFANSTVRTALLRSLSRRRGTAFAPRRLPVDRYARVGAWLREAIDVDELLAACGVAP
jgi:adenosylcobyric acid synthase